MKQNDFKIAVFAVMRRPEIMKEALKILKLIADKKKINLQLTEGLSAAALRHIGVPLPDSSLEIACKATVLLELWETQMEALDYSLRPERALGLREKLGLFANLRRLLLLTNFLMHHRLRKMSCRALIYDCPRIDR